MSIMAESPPVVTPPSATDLHREVVLEQGRAVLAEAEALRAGCSLQDVQTGELLGRVAVSLNALLWLASDGAR